MKKTIAVISLSALLIACGDDKQADTKIDTGKYDCIVPPPDATIPEAEDELPEVINECYRFDEDEQHDWIILTQVQDSVWGELHFQWEGKDGSDGTFSGKVRGDTIRILFRSYNEGHHLATDVAFLRKGDKLYKAQDSPDSDETGDYYYFTKPPRNFNDKQPMMKIPCEK